MTATDERALVTMSPSTRGATTAMTVSDDAVKLEATKIMGHRGVGVFPQNMTALQAGQLARLALAYGLDPFTGELILYQNRPYVTIDGRIRIANEHPAYDGMECRPATDEERKAFRCGENEHLWLATVWRKDRRIPSSVYGRASANDGNPVSTKWAQEMASKRARHRALRDAFSMKLPGAEEEEAYDNNRAYNSGLVVLEQDTQSSITSEQSAALHATVHDLEWSDAEYRAVLRHTYQVETSKDLTEGQATSVLEMLHLLHKQGTAAAFLERIPRGQDVLSVGRQGDDDYYNADAIAARRQPAPTIIDDNGYADAPLPPDDGPLFESADETLEAMVESDTSPAVMPTAKDIEDYARGLALAQRLELDVAPYETSGGETRKELFAKAGLLKTATDRRTAELAKTAR